MISWWLSYREGQPGRDREDCAEARVDAKLAQGE